MCPRLLQSRRKRHSARATPSMAGHTFASTKLGVSSPTSDGDALARLASGEPDHLHSAAPAINHLGMKFHRRNLNNDARTKIHDFAGDA